MIEAKWLKNGDNLSDSFDIRREVFVVEQQIDKDIEFNGSDRDAIILVLYEEAMPVATGRLLKQEDGYYVLGRIAVLKAHRGKKYGDFVVRLLIRKAFELGSQKQYVHAQIQVEEFYKKLGFVSFGEEYMEAGIPHVTMVHEGDISGACK